MRFGQKLPVGACMGLLTSGSSTNSSPSTRRAKGGEGATIVLNSNPERRGVRLYFSSFAFSFMPFGILYTEAPTNYVLNMHDFQLFIFSVFVLLWQG